LMCCGASQFLAAMTCTDIPQAGKTVDELSAIGVMQDRALTLYPDERIFLVIGMKKRVHEVGVIGVLNFLYIDSHEFSQFRDKLRIPQPPRQCDFGAGYA